MRSSVVRQCGRSPCGRSNEGNVTGLSLQGPDLAGKRLELLRELAPGRRQLAILVNVGYPAAREELAQVQTAARAQGLESAVLEMRRAEDIAPAFNGAKGRADALYVVGDALVTANVALIAKLALDAGLPAISAYREFAVLGRPHSLWAKLPRTVSACGGRRGQNTSFSSRLNSTSLLISRAGKRSG